MPLPSNVSFGTVVGTFLLAVADSPDDTDRDPEGVPASDLKIRFTPDLPKAVAKDPTATPPAYFALQDVTCTIGPDGTLRGPDGAPGVRLVASTNPALQPSGWTWQVILSGTGFPMVNFSFPLDPGATVDLATVLQVPDDPGVTLEAWLAAVAAAQAAQAAAEAAAERAQNFAVSLTQAAYDALPSKNPSTLYLITT
jgi:hypothetical protein